MTFAEACGVVDRITYKPGWKVTARMRDLKEGDILHLTLTYFSRDARPGLADNTIDLMNTVERPLDYMTADLLLQEIEHLVMATERHEAQEWLRYGGASSPTRTTRRGPAGPDLPPMDIPS